MKKMKNLIFPAAFIGLVVFLIIFVIVGLSNKYLPYYTFNAKGEKVTGPMSVFYAKGIDLPEYFRGQGVFTNGNGREFAYSFSLFNPNNLKTLQGNYDQVKKEFESITRQNKEKFVLNLKERTNTITTMDFRTMVWTLQRTLNDMDYWDFGHGIEYDENTVLGPLPIVHHAYSTPDTTGLENIGQTWLWFWEISELEKVRELAVNPENTGCFFWQGSISMGTQRWIYSLFASGAFAYQEPRLNPKYDENKKLIEDAIKTLVQEGKEYSDEDRDIIMKKIKVHFNLFLQAEDIQWFHWFKA